MFNIKGDLKEITRHLNRTQKKQIPFAASMAINNTLKQVVKAEQAQIVKKLDKPTPFTVKAFKINWSRKNMLHGEVVIKPAQWKYLKYQIEGGTRTKHNIGVPTSNAKLNKYGNIPGRRKGLIKKKNQFIGTFNGTSGVWERGHYSKSGKFTSAGKSRSTSLKLVVGFHDSVTYRKRFPFHKIADGVARSQFQKNFVKALNQALRTAR